MSTEDLKMMFDDGVDGVCDLIKGVTSFGSK
jgi:hypothetical protein